MAQVFKVTGTKNGRPFEHIAKVAGGNKDENALKQHYKDVKHPNYKDVTDLKVEYVGRDDGEAAVAEDGTPIPPGPLVETAEEAKAPRAGASSSSSGGRQGR